MIILYILLYLLLAVFTYLCIKEMSRYVASKENHRHIWEWKDIIIAITMSVFFPILSIIVVFLAEIRSFIKLPKNPPKWL